jgi:hypothetical protein
VVEQVNAIVGRWCGGGRARYWGLEKVSIQMTLASIAANAPQAHKSETHAEPWCISPCLSGLTKHTCRGVNQRKTLERRENRRFSQKKTPVECQSRPLDKMGALNHLKINSLIFIWTSAGQIAQRRFTIH